MLFYSFNMVLNCCSVVFKLETFDEQKNKYVKIKMLRIVKHSEPLSLDKRGTVLT